MIGEVSTAEGGLGNIEIAVDEPNSRFEGKEIPVMIEEGSKRLILTRKLDKEGPEGETGIVIGIRCRKMSNPLEPSIIIPVRIIVTDANDHAPEFIGTPYSANVSEVTVVGTILLPASVIRATDGDQPGAFSTIEYYVEPGPFSHLARFENPFSGNLVLAAPLDFETLPKFWITIRAQDQGEPPNTATTTVSINVLDADDQNPRFLDDKYLAILPDSNRAGERLNMTPRALHAVDPDSGINSPIELSFSSSGSDSAATAYFSLDSKFGEIRLKKSLASHIQLPLTLVIRATQVDNRDRYALTTVTVQSKRNLQKPPLKFTQSNHSFSVLENFPVGHVVMTLRTNRGEGNSRSRVISSNNNNNDDSPLTFQILGGDSSIPFEVRNNGELVVKSELDFERQGSYLLSVRVSDGKQSDLTNVNISILNVNDHDPEFSEGHYTFFVSESQINSSDVVGVVKASDADSGDSVSLSLKGPFARMFSIDNQGVLRIVNIKELNTTQCHLILVASDSGSPPRSSSVAATVHFPASLFSYRTTPSLSSMNRNEQDTDQQFPSSFFPNLLTEEDITKKNVIPYNTNRDEGRVRSERKHELSERIPVEEGVNALFSASSSSAIILVITLGALIATLFIIIITLVVHVLKQRKFTNVVGSPATSSSGNSSGSASPTNPYTSYYSTTRRTSTSNGLYSKRGPGEDEDDLDANDSGGGGGSFNPPIVPGLGSRGVENPIFMTSKSQGSKVNNNSAVASASNLSSRYFSEVSRSPGASDPESGVVSDTPSHEKSHQNQHHQQEGVIDDELVDIRSSRFSPTLPPPPSSANNVTCTTIGPGGSISSGSGNSSRISVVKWPQGSIPRRVKKLTWEDEVPAAGGSHHQQISVKDETDVSSLINSQSNISSSHLRSHTLIPSNNSIQTTDLDAPPTTTGSVQVTGLKSTLFSSSHPPHISSSSPTPHLSSDTSHLYSDDSSKRNHSLLQNGLPDLTVYF